MLFACRKDVKTSEMDTMSPDLDGKKRFGAKILSELEVTTRRSLKPESALLFCPLKINIAI